MVYSSWKKNRVAKILNKIDRALRKAMYSQY